MKKLEAIVLIVVVLAGLAGIYYFFSAGAGQATRMLKGCEGDYTLQLRIGGAKQGADYRFKGISGHVELLDIKGGKALLSLDGENTGYLGFGEVYLGKQAGIKMSSVDKTTSAFCMASTVEECVKYEWLAEELPDGSITGSRVCVQYASSADMKFGKAGHVRGFT
jgi:hypothetical protein